MKKLSPLLILFISFTLSAPGQDNPLDTLVKKFGQHREKTLHEKVYGHLDRKFYLTGETLWLKIYAVDGSFHKSIDVSKVAYAEILDRANFPVLQAKIELKDGMGNGSFFLPASLTSGNYKLRLYTNWMKNFNHEFYFDEIFTIVNPFVIPETTQTSAPKGCSVDFFPEGGNLVAGIQSKVAFKVIDESGKGIDCSGFILDNQGDTITSFTPKKFGLGHFSFTPAGGEQYKAILADPQGAEVSHSFPTVHTSGYVMQLRDSADHLRIDVMSKGLEGQFVLLFAHARQIIARAERQSLRNNSASFLLKKADMPEGISHLTVFNEQLKPLCERLYFRYPDKGLNIEMTSNAKVYNFRKKVSLSLNTTSHAARPARASVSLSVYKIDSLSDETTTSIFPYLWLTSDLTGTVETPEYYFNSKETDLAAAMDNLMLTHGWRRFDWQHVLSGNGRFVHLPEINGHIINGVVTRSGQKQGSVFTYLGSSGRIIRAYGSWSNAQGEVRFEIKDFYGSRRIIIQTKADSAEAYEVNVRNPFSTVMDGQKMPELKLNEKHSEELLSRSIAMQVQDVYYYEQTRNLFSKPKVDSSAFYGRADNTYLLDDYTRFPVMEEVMREYVPGVFVRKRRDGFHFLVIDQVNDGILPDDPMVLVDGIPVFDVDDIMKMDPLRVQKLEVVKRQYYLGQAVFSGIVSYSTYNGDLGDLKLNPQSVSLDYDGLQLQREFYSPRYDIKVDNDRLPDQRYLLHWQPDIFTDEEGKQKVEFYTSDVPGNYRVVAEGLSKDGSSGTGILNFSVEAPDNP
ncbi:MAG: hypothetical protein WEB30_05375 [Cyclobacteriaceae bacterium]